MRNPTSVQLTLRRGMSLIELMVVIAIIAVLAGLSLPAIQKVRLSARRMESANNLKQMSLAVHSWYDVHKFLPPTVGWDNTANKAVDNGADGTVFFHILSHMEQDALYRKFLGPLDKGCGISIIAPQPVGVSAYRANRFSFVNLTFAANKTSFKNPKYLISPLDKSTSGTPTITSYIANKDLLDKRIGIEKVSNGASNTMLLTEGLKTCSGNVYDPLNYSIQSTVSNYTQVVNGKPYVQTINSPANSWHASRTNNWAVGSEAYNRDTGNIETQAVVQDYTDPLNPKNVILGLQVPYVANSYGGACADCNDYYNPNPCATWSPGVGDAMGNIPAFIKKDPYYEPWSNFQITMTYNYTWDGKTNQWGPPTTTTTPVQTNPLGQAMRATYQDGRAWSVNPSLAPSPAPSSNCLWFGVQAHYGALLVAMLDGGVRSVSRDVTPDSWNAAISPDTTGVSLVGADFFD